MSVTAFQRRRRELEEAKANVTDRMVPMGTSGTSDTSPKETSDSSGGEKSLEDHTVPELKARAKEREIEGYSGMNKAGLIAALSEPPEAPETPETPEDQG